MTVYKKTMQKYEEKTKETCQNGKKISQNGKICGNDKPKRPFYHLKYKKPQKKRTPTFHTKWRCRGSTFISYERYFYIFAMMPLVSSRNLTMMPTSLPSGTWSLI